MSTGAEKGRAFLLKTTDGVTPVTYVTIAGARTTGLSINGEAVDITNKDSGGFQELLGGAGTTKFSITGSGVFKNTAMEILLRTRAIAKSLDLYKLFFEDGEVMALTAQCTKVDYKGDHNKEVTYDISLESSGQPTFTP